MKLAFIGFGVLGQYVRDAVQEVHSAPAKDHVFFDDNLARDGVPEGTGKALSFKDWDKDEFAEHTFYVCLGYRHLTTKRDILRRLIELGRSVPSFVHASCYVHPSVKIGPGSWLYPGCNVDRGSVIGMGSWFLNGSVIPHDCVVGDSVWFGPGVTLSGNVTIGDCTFVGTGTAVSNGVTVGSDVIVGLATAVTRDVASGASVIGNPMRILERRLNLI